MGKRNLSGLTSGFPCICLLKCVCVFDVLFLCGFTEDFTPVSYRASLPPKPARQVPPYNGFGSEEDSLCSCQGLLLKPPQKDFKKLMEKDR